MRRRFLRIEIITYGRGSSSPSLIHNPSPKRSTPNTTRFVLQTLAAGLVLGTLWGLRLLKQRQTTDAEIIARQKQQERDNRTDRWLTEIEQNMREENNDE